MARVGCVPAFPPFLVLRSDILVFLRVSVTYVDDIYAKQSYAQNPTITARHFGSSGLRTLEVWLRRTINDYS